MSQQDMDQPAVPRVAWDSDGDAWEEIIAGNGEPTAVEILRHPSLPLCAVHPEAK